MDSFLIDLELELLLPFGFSFGSVFVKCVKCETFMQFYTYYFRRLPACVTILALSEQN